MIVIRWVSGLIEGMTDWLSSIVAWFFYYWIRWLVAWLIGRFNYGLIGGSFFFDDWYISGLNGCLVKWLIKWVNDWLINWYIGEYIGWLLTSNFSRIMWLFRHNLSPHGRRWQIPKSHSYARRSFGWNLAWSLTLDSSIAIAVDFISGH